MNEQQLSSLPRMPLPIRMPLPMTAWWSGFDYVFGYQMKLVKEFWGIPNDD